ncbi:helix-turn-helix domain-containing protein [Pseudobutyrivibrio sp.]|uniref:helix-turn-helix domain-containing protein n=1 Tax=Pseudobutyrivibrio sp. TaxID=2014367 RepID=UPI001B556473|nr:helix-turn-helix transcriptional regulator [Pseudobutyrivibrio sp.]MBP3263510.1 helix-turn-helix transcriptional regulator [Pseudobutyrivibrio sp.]
MDQIKIGKFLRELRNEKGITQEKLGEILGVAGRTVSRWETGFNLPDISLLVMLADFYDVDVREIIDGERKQEFSEDAKTATEAVADYATIDKSKTLGMVRWLGIIGTILMLALFAMQCKSYEVTAFKTVSLLVTFVAFSAMFVMTLYVNDKLEQIVKNKTVINAIKISAIVIGGVCIRYLFMIILMLIYIVISMFDEADKPVSGINNYDKAALVSENHSDLDSYFKVFPDDTANMVEATYVSKLPSNLVGTTGYTILEATYSKDDYDEELARLSDISLTIENGRVDSDEKITQDIMYDESMYVYPAYIAADGNCGTYEYALLDESECKIIYVLVKYISETDIEEINAMGNYLKADTSEYEESGVETWKKFSIYSYQFPGTKELSGYEE